MGKSSLMESMIVLILAHSWRQSDALLGRSDVQLVERNVERAENDTFVTTGDGDLLTY